MPEEDGKYIHDAIMTVVNNQIRNINPPKTKQTLDRLIKEGYTKEDARKLIGYVVLSELNEMMKLNRVFDEAKFVAALKALPEEPPDY